MNTLVIDSNKGHNRTLLKFNWGTQCSCKFILATTWNDVKLQNGNIKFYSCSSSAVLSRWCFIDALNVTLICTQIQTLAYKKDIFNENSVELLRPGEELIYPEACMFTLIGSKLPTNAAFSIKCEKSNMFLCARLIYIYNLFNIS